MAQPTLKLGIFDKDGEKLPVNKLDYFNQFHEPLSGSALFQKTSFRGTASSQYYKLKSASGIPVTEFQQAMFNCGFYNQGDFDGVFGYRTQAAARLFQEYMRSIEGQAHILPDGIIGAKSYEMLVDWDRNYNSALDDAKQCVWDLDFTPGKPNPEATAWFRLLNSYKNKYAEEVKQSNPGNFIAQQLKKSEEYSQATATRKIKDWSFDPKDVHLIGIRRKEEKAVNQRKNDDVFVLLLNGHIFKFFGSTDPSASIAGRSDEPFLLPGQHLYYFSWHKMYSAQKVYRAFRPAGKGVLVFRDQNADNRFTGSDVKNRKPTRNTTINIHWTPKKSGTWSAGCQVISGKGYINHKDEYVDCSHFASLGYANLGQQTKGAYNFLMDLLTTNINDISLGGNRLRYTLIHDEDLDLEPAIGQSWLNDATAKFSI